MKRETVALKNGSVEIYKEGNLIYLDVFGEYTDEDAIAMTAYLDQYFASINGPTIRVWDSTNIPQEGFLLSAKGTDHIARWTHGVKKQWPDNVSCLIGPTPLQYGVSRMYQIKASQDESDVIVVRDISELPAEVRDSVLRMKSHSA